MDEKTREVFKEIPQREYLNSFFSYSETIDIYHTILLLSGRYLEEEKEKDNPAISVSVKPNKAYIKPEFEDTQMVFQNKQNLYDFIEKWQEGLEIQGIPQKQSMQSLFLLQMGLYIIREDGEIPDSTVKFEIEDEERLKKSIYISKLLWSYPKEDNNFEKISNTSFLSWFSLITKNYLRKLSEVDSKTLSEDPNAFIDLEYETKVSLNNLFLIIINNFENAEMKTEITNAMYNFEENAILTIRLSLDLSIGPIRKCLILFYIYMSWLFGEVKEIPKEQSYVKVSKLIINSFRSLVN